jgi:hypothetical protein
MNTYGWESGCRLKVRYANISSSPMHTKQNQFNKDSDISCVMFVSVGIAPTDEIGFRFA